MRYAIEVSQETRDRVNEIQARMGGQGKVTQGQVVSMALDAWDEAQPVELEGRWGQIESPVAPYGPGEQIVQQD